MDLAQALKSLPEGPGWAVLVVVMALIFGPTGVLSKEAAEKNYWIISAAARRWQDRKRRAIERDQEIEVTEIRVLREDLARLARNYHEDRSRWADAEAELRAENARLRDYIVMVATWFHQLSLKAAREGWAMEELPRYDQWVNDNPNA